MGITGFPSNGCHTGIGFRQNNIFHQCFCFWQSKPGYQLRIPHRVGIHIERCYIRLQSIQLSSRNIVIINTQIIIHSSLKISIPLIAAFAQIVVGCMAQCLGIQCHRACLRQFIYKYPSHASALHIHHIQPFTLRQSFALTNRLFTSVIGFTDGKPCIFSTKKEITRI